MASWVELTAIPAGSSERSRRIAAVESMARPSDFANLQQDEQDW